jgi:bifunctional N-acetylglucosamine-1-phosphate-uridyltransferase/glucosamine-1-phosphate-acetyltransferase GlmU-like protein
MINIAAIVMAGGKGTRMQSEKPKVLHEIGGEPMIFHTIRNIQNLGIKDVYVVVSYKAQEVEEAIAPKFLVNYAQQLEPLGTGDAVKSALKKMTKDYQTILVVGGDDSAFYTPETINEFINSHIDTKSTVSLMTLIDHEKERMGKVFRKEAGEFDQLLEYTDYTKLDLSSDEINCGVYLFDYQWLSENINLIEKNPIKAEYYLTDLINLAKKQGEKIHIFKLKNKGEWFGVNTPEELKQANQQFILKK